MSFRRRLAVVAAALALAGAAFVLFVHIPPVRRAALRYVLPAVERQYGLRLEASRLDYNLAALRVGLADFRLSAPESPDEPFFSAEYVSVTLARRALVGPIAFEHIGLTNARVLVRKRPDGTTNIPAASNTPGGEPAPLSVATLDAPRIAIDLRDEEAARFLWAPALAVHLKPGGGSIRLTRPAELNTETQLTSISSLEGEAAFDGRALRLASLRLQSPELSAQLDGSVTILAGEPAVNLTVRGTGEAARLARWVVTNGFLPRGEFAFEAEIGGPFAELEMRLRVSSPRIAWRSLAAADLAVRLRATPAAADIEEAQLGFEGGRVSASARVPFEQEGEGRVEVSWSGVNAASAALAIAPDAGLVPSATLSGTLTARGGGTDPARWTGTLRAFAVGRPNARGRLALDGDLELQLRDDSWQLAGRQRVGGVAPLTFALRGRGTSNAAPADTPIDGTVRLAATDIPALVRVLDATGLADLEADVVTAGQLDADLRVGGSIARPSLEGVASIQGLAAAQMEVSALHAAVRGQPRQLALSFAVDVPEAIVAGQAVTGVRAAGRVTEAGLDLEALTARQASGPGTLAADGAYSFRTRRYVVSVEGQQWQLAPVPERPVGAQVELRFAGEGSIDAPRGLGDVTLRQTTWRDVAVGTVTASVALEGRTAALEAAAPEFAARATARVQLDPPYAAVVDARAEGLDLARILRDIGSATPGGTSLSGTTTFVAHAELPLETWRSGSATLEIASLEARAGELPLRLVEPARARYEGERLYIERFEAAAGDTRLSASGDLAVFDAPPDSSGIVVTATGEVEEVARAAAATKLIDVPVTGGSGPVALLARITGTVQAPVVAADLEVGPGSVALENLPAISRVRVRAHAEDGWVELREGMASYQNADLSVTGRAPVSLFTNGAEPSGEAVIRARAANLTPAVLAPFLEPDTLAQIEGSIDATLEAAAPSLDLTALTGELRIDRFDVRIADLPVTQRVPTRIVARDGFARVEAWDWAGQGATLSVRGQVRLEDRQAAILADGVVDLRVLTPFVRDAGITTAGRLEPRLSITGALDTPRIDGDLVVSDGEIRLVDPRVFVSDLAVRTVLTRTSARIMSLTGAVNGGALTGGGALDVDAAEGVSGQLSASVRGVALEFPQGLRSELDADLTLDVAPSAERLSGVVTVVRSSYREPMAVVTGLLAGLRGERIAAVTGYSPLAERLALDVRVVTEEDVTVDNNYARAQLGGDLRVIGTAAAPGVSGRAELREGGQLFVGRNVYTVNVGAIDFANPVAIEPNLNVEAVTRAGGEEIEVTITGPAESPAVNLRSPSNPDLGQAELASLLLTGRRLEDLAPGDAAFVGTQVLGNFSAEVLGFASRAVGLDTLRLGGVESTTVRRDPTVVATDLDPTTRLTFGKSLGTDLDVTFSQSLRDGDAQTWIVDYLPARGLDLRLVSDDDDLRSYGFRHDVSIGTGGRRPAAAGSARQRRELRVVAVNLTGNLVLPEARVRDALQLGPGDRFDFGRWQTDRDRLERLYRMQGYLTARVVARRSDEGGGVALTYEIAPGPQTRIDVTGLTVDAALRSQLETAWAEAVFDDFVVDEAAGIVRRRLAADGHLQPAIDARIAEAGGAKTLVVTVDPGSRSTATLVRIEGVPDDLAGEILAHLRERGLLEGAVADPVAVEREVETYLRGRGRVGARVSAGAPLFEATTAILPVVVEAGPAHTIALVRFDEALTLPEAGLREAAALEAGAPFDPGAVEAARDRLVSLYRREGFASVSVAAQPAVRTEQAAVDVVFRIEEGRRQVLGDVMVAGNRAIDADVIVRAVGLAPGAPLRAEDVLRARTRVFDTGLFRRIDVTSEPLESPASDAGTIPMRLRVSVEEWPAARLRYGFVAAEERPEDSLEGRKLVPGVSADVTRRTLFGRAIVVGGAAEWQRREQRGRAFLNAPTFMGLPLESSLIAERSREQFEAVTLVTNRTSVTWEQRTRVARNLSLSYAYTFERNHTFDTRTFDPDALAFDITINIARLNAAAAWDTRDDPSDTTRGLLASSSFELAPEAIGSDIRFLRQLWQGYFFQPWRGVVLASAARAGVVVPLGGQELILSERFFAGGSRTVRGMAEGGLGPRDFFGDPAGGRMMVVLNQEARVPIHRWLRGVAFVDAGNVFLRPGDASLADLVGSAGAGLRLVTPFALLRADYARAMWGATHKGGRWTFGIGQTF